MPSRPEGRFGLPLRDDTTLAASMLAVTSLISLNNEFARVDPQKHLAETKVLPSKQAAIAEASGKLIVQSNFFIEWHKYHSVVISKLSKDTSTDNTVTVSPTVYAEYLKVHNCEEPEVYRNGVLVSGGWTVRSQDPHGFSGGLGIRNDNWIYYSTHPTDLHFPANAADATPAEQIIVDQRLQPNPPDQNGCQPGGY